jgi:phosphoesterase RecJ-like protein
VNDYCSTATPEELAARLGSAQRTLITTHAKPDGDAIGSCLALARAMHAQDREAEIWLMGPVPPPLLAVAGDTPVSLVDNEMPGGDYDLAVLLDTGAWSQVEPLAEWLRPRRTGTLGIDHHAHGDDIASMRIVDTSCASATQVLVPILDAMGATINGGAGGVAEALFTGLATDTGWFRFSNADAAVFRLAAQLLDAGVDKDRLYQLIEENDRPARMALIARALASLQVHHRGSVAIMRLHTADFADTGGSQEDLTGVVNEPMSLAGIRASVLLTETEPGRVKISLRSKPAGPAGPVIDVNRVANGLGGGGHVHAAGARFDGDLDGAAHAVLAAFAGAP